ncbi:hypothetical protein [Methylobacterium sp. J-026]|nr:hypothetical protein [Methylobacterium sp. J-026]
MFKIIDIKTGNIVLGRVSKIEAHKRVDLLNSCGIVRYRAVAQ